MFHVFQLFHLDIAKVDRNVAHIAMAIHVCSEYFICFSRRIFVSVLSGCYICFYKCFRHICSKCFSCFCTYVASVSSECFKNRSGVAASVSYAYLKCFIYFQTYVVSVVSGCFKSRSDVCISLLAFLSRIGVSSSSGAY